MSRQLLSDFIYHLDGDNNMQLGHAPDDVQKWLETVGLSIDILRFLQWDWPQTDTQIGHIAVMSSSNIRKDQMTGPLLPQKFLNLGSAPNGDFFVIDFSTEQCRPGFITHEEWSPPATDARQFFQPIARSMESFLYRIVEAKYISTDYYAAKAFNQFLVEVGSPHEPGRSAAPHLMHTSTVHFQLNEAITHLQEVVSELDDGRMHSDDTPELAVALGHILDHICKAWNAREISLEQMAAVSQEEHDRMCNTVPNFHGQRVLGELACG